MNIEKTQDYYSLTLIVWCMKLKPKMFMKKFSKVKEMFDLSIYSPKSKHYDDSNKQAFVKEKD